MARIARVAVEAPQRPGFVSADDFITQLSAEPEMAELLAAGRRELAGALADPTQPKTLHALRLEAGLSQAELGHRIGSTQGNISLLEAGKRDPLFSTVEDLANALNVSIEVVGTAIRASREHCS